MEENSEKLSKLIDEVSQLRDLFLRRLYDDKTKKAALESLANQNAILNDKVSGRDIESMLKELLLVCDRIEAQDGVSDFDLSIRDEILEVFLRRNVIPIEIVVNLGEKFNPNFHHAVDTVSVAEKEKHGLIVSVRRKGYLVGDRVLRPAEVVVAVDNRMVDV